MTRRIGKRATALMSARCSGCGRLNIEGHKTCPECGVRINGRTKNHCTGFGRKAVIRRRSNSRCC